MFSNTVWFLTDEDTIDFTKAISPSHLKTLLALPNYSQDVNVIADKLLNGKD